MTNQFSATTTTRFTSCEAIALDLAESLSDECHKNQQLEGVFAAILAYSASLQPLDLIQGRQSNQDAFNSNNISESIGELFYLNSRQVCKIKRLSSLLSQEIVILSNQILCLTYQIDQNSIDYFIELGVLVNSLVFDGHRETLLRSEFKTLAVNNMNLKLQNTEQLVTFNVYTSEINSLLSVCRSWIQGKISELRKEIPHLILEINGLQKAGPDYLNSVKRYQQILDQKELVLDDISRINMSSIKSI